MHSSLNGSCQCRAITYRITGQVLTLFACHCTECQKQSGSAFGLALWVKAHTLDIDGPTPSRWTRQTPSGRQMHCDFCPACGTRLFHRIEGNGDVLSLKPGTLDGQVLPPPVAQVWTGSAHPWALLERVARHAGNPQSFESLFSAWSSSHSDRL